MKLNLKVYDEKTSKESSEEGQLFLKLELTETGNDIILIVVDKEGIKIENGNILYINTHEGYLIFLPSIGENIPLKTDIEGHILHTFLETEKDRVKARISHNVFKKFMMEIKESVEAEEDKKEVH